MCIERSKSARARAAAKWSMSSLEGDVAKWTVLGTRYDGAYCGTLERAKIARHDGSVSRVPCRGSCVVLSRLRWRHGVPPLPPLEAQATCAKVVTAGVSLSRRDYDRLPKKEKNTQYLIVD